MDKLEWDRIVIASGGSFLQSWAWGEMQERMGIPYWRLVAKKAGEPKEVALVLRREIPMGWCWLYAPRGNFWRGSELVSRVLATAQKERAMFVKADPASPEDPGVESILAFRKAEGEVQPRHTLVLDLAAEEKLLVGMRQKTRYNIRLAKRKGVTVRFSREQRDLAEFLRLAKEVTRRGGFHFHPDDYYKTMLETLGLDGMLELAVAEYEGMVLGVFWLIKYGETVTYVHGATSSERRAVMAPHLLMWESIKKAKKQGARHFDFFGVAPLGAGADHLWAGITRFKEGFGGRRENYAGAYDYVLRPGMYALFNLARRARGVWN